MPPRCAAVRTRVGITPGPPHSLDGIWITDSMLREAIERYNRVSAQSRHSLSSCPGPIESRRRLGKRHMTALMPESRFAPPPWSIEFPLRLDEWKWEPPNTVEDRARNRKRFSLSRLLNRSIEWLENFDDDAPARDLVAHPSTTAATVASPPPKTRTDIFSGDMVDEVVTEVVNMESISAGMEGSGLFDIDMEYTQTIDLGHIYGASYFTNEIASLNDRLQALDPTQMTDRSLWIACRPFADYLQYAIPQKRISGADLRAALQPFTSTTKLHLNNQILTTAEARIGNLILRILQESDQIHTYPVSFWLSSAALLKRMDKQQIVTYLYFSRLTKAAQKTSKGWLRHSLILDTLSCAVEFLAALPSSHKHVTKYNTIIISGIKNLGKARPPSMWERVMELLIQRHQGDHLENLQRQMALLMSFDSHAQTSKCLEAYPGVWSSEDAFLFTKGRLWSTNCLPADSMPSFLHLPITDTNWSRLVSQISAAKPQKRKLLFQQLCQATKNTGTFRVMVEHNIERMGWDKTGDSTTLREIAIAIGDHKQALNLWRMANVWLGPAFMKGQWDWTAWTPYMEKIIKDPSIGDSIIWRVLSMHEGLDNKARPGAALRGINTATALLESMGKWFLEANHLNNRQTLRRITKCISTYQSINKSLSPQMLLCLVDVILRDFEHDHKWSQDKLDWMMELIKHNLGEEQARLVLVQLHGWQWTIRNRDMKQQAPLVDRIERELGLVTQENTTSSPVTTEGLEDPLGLNMNDVKAFNKAKVLSKHVKFGAMNQHRGWRQGGQIFNDFKLPNGKAARKGWSNGWIPWQVLQREKHAAYMMAITQTKASMEDAPNECETREWGKNQEGQHDSLAKGAGVESAI